MREEKSTMACLRDSIVPGWKPTMKPDRHADEERKASCSAMDAEVVVCQIRAPASVYLPSWDIDEHHAAELGRPWGERD